MPSGRFDFLNLSDLVRNWQELWTQFGFININLMRSRDPKREAEIISDGYGYGQQLGRIVEALHVLVAHMRTTTFGHLDRWPKDEQHKLFEFSSMAKEIADTKRETKINEDFDSDSKEIARQSLNNFLSAMERVKCDDEEYFRIEIRDRLLELLDLRE